MAAARRLFRRRGVVAVGIEAIRVEAKSSPSSIYHLFEGIPAIRLAVLESIFVGRFAELAAAVDEADDAQAAITALITNHLDWVTQHRPDARLMYELTALTYPPALLAAFETRKAAITAPMMAGLRRFVDDGTLPPWPLPLADVIIMGPTHEASRRLLLRAPFDLDGLRHLLPRLAWAAVVEARQSPTQVSQSSAGNVPPDETDRQW